MKHRKPIATLALLMAVSVLLVACPDPEPSGEDGETATPADATPSEAEPAPDPSQTESKDAEAAPSGTLAVEREKLIGRWGTAGGSSDAARYVYQFAPDGSLTVTREGNVVLDGEYEVTVEQAVRLLVRDPESGELQPEMTLRLMVRRGEGEYVFDVEPSGNTLWLRKMTTTDSSESD